MQEGVDYYIDEKGFYVFTAKYLLERGHCCRNACRHCPYGFSDKKKTIFSQQNETLSDKSNKLPDAH